MRKIIFTFLFTTSYVNAEVDLFPDEKVNQFILIQNNAEKCFQPKLWNARNDAERQIILAQRSEMDMITEFQYDMALMSELFGNEITVKFLEDLKTTEKFNKKLERLWNNRTTVDTPQECETLSQYYFQIKKKHFF